MAICLAQTCCRWISWAQPDRVHSFPLRIPRILCRSSKSTRSSVLLLLACFLPFLFPISLQTNRCPDPCGCVRLGFIPDGQQQHRHRQLTTTAAVALRSLLFWPDHPLTSLPTFPRTWDLLLLFFFVVPSFYLSIQLFRAGAFFFSSRSGHRAHLPYKTTPRSNRSTLTNGFETHKHRALSINHCHCLDSQSPGSLTSSSLFGHLESFSSRYLTLLWKHCSFPPTQLDRAKRRCRIEYIFRRHPAS
ncbi:hypothetical protein V8F20_003148 [Naviculisporaceae sp. PSN 640]